MDQNIKTNRYLIFETIIVFGLLSSCVVLLFQSAISTPLKWLFYFPLLLFQGLWFYRFYIVGHEASHRKLFLKNRFINDLIGSIILLPIMVPINVYRKIHIFHHGFNRKDNHTSALDTFTTSKPSVVRKIWFYILWYLAVFAGGFFIHSLVSVLLFLFVPPRLARKISPAFNDWTIRDQFTAILLFSLGVGLHLGVYSLFGKEVYLLTLGYPMLAFAWVLSLLVYIFHYDTTVGNQVRYNVRSVNRVPFFSWVLMNFNEHATHHQNPNIPWYELPKKRKDLPQEFSSKNQNTRSFFRAIIQQIKGPRIIHESKNQEIQP